MVNEHNCLVPRDFWLEEWEKSAIAAFYLAHPDDSYRRITFMMLDADIVAVSPSSTYRVLKGGRYLRKWNNKPTKKGTGFNQPDRPHRHWHLDVCYINICGTFYYMGAQFIARDFKSFIRLCVMSQVGTSPGVWGQSPQLPTYNC